MKNVSSLLLLVADTTLSDIYTRRFTAAGWKVYAVRSIAEAERKAVRTKPTVFLLDVSTVDDVAATLKRCKTLPTMMKTKIVLLSDGPTSIANDQPTNYVTIYARHATPQEILKTLTSLV